jgi:hypothetical protein
MTVVTSTQLYVCKDSQTDRARARGRSTNAAARAGATAPDKATAVSAR